MKLDDFPQVTHSPNAHRAATPNQQVEAASPESVAADEALLVQLATAITDIKAMEAQVWKLWREELSGMLPDVQQMDSDSNVSLEGTTSVAAAASQTPFNFPYLVTLRHSLSTIISLVPPLSGQAIAILTRRGCDALLPMRSIPSQFRAMSSKRMPSEPSHFVSLIFRSLKTFFGVGTGGDAPGGALKDDFLKSYAEEVFENVAQRYATKKRHTVLYFY